MTDKEMLRQLGKYCYRQPTRVRGQQILIDIMRMDEKEFLDKVENMTLKEFCHYAGLPSRGRLNYRRY